ncbi:hypothetical protein GJ698_23360 [Pseudoduganella sp. FT26W]|uniref:DJ-1/PfpI domain-containing protein n=2 Tax=Duganella aquatilis TaxID=2666082 RepID=A0A844D7T3_9BURK|nr:hypothetical protein [Duganella aquatilis]
MTMKYVTAFLLAMLMLAGANAATIKVAFVINEGANVMDIAGSWEVFQDTMLDDDKETMPFELYTVAPSKTPLHTTGSGRPGMTITPDYGFSDAPAPDIVVVGAQSGGPELREWLKRQHADGKTVLSVCTGAFQLARAGLLNGKSATTHHWYLGNFAEEFPDVKLVREVRFVQADPHTYTAGGLSSGMDLSLHIVAELFGQQQAQRTANYMEYQGTGWKTNAGVAVLTAPVKRQLWRGRIKPDTEILLHVLTTGASSTYTTDIPALHVADAPTRVKTADHLVTFSLAVGDGVATFSGSGEAGATAISGTFIQDGVAYPLTLSLSARDL